MPTYVYETIPSRPGGRSRRCEIDQRMREPALTNHPETGEPIRRVPAGGIGVIAGDKATPATGCGSDCGIPGSDRGGCGGCCLHG